MHIAQRKELDVHKTKQKRDRNRTTTSLVLDSSMQRGRWEFRLISEFGCLYRQYLRAAEYLFSRYFLLILLSPNISICVSYLAKIYVKLLSSQRYM